MSRRNKLSVVALWSLMMVGILVACGPTEADVERMVADAIAASEAGTRQALESQSEAIGASEAQAMNAVTVLEKSTRESINLRASANANTIADVRRATQNEIDAQAIRFNDVVEGSLDRVTDRTQSLVDGLVAAITESEARAMSAVEDVAEASAEERDALTSRLNDLLEQDADRTLARVQKVFDDYVELVDSDLAMLADRVSGLSTSLDDQTEWMTEETEHLDGRAYRLEQTICEADYWLNSTRSMLWWSLDHLSGGETTLEEAENFWNGLAILDDYESISHICAVHEDGAWVITLLESDALR